MSIEIDPEGKMVDVFFVDYGESVITNCNDIQPLPVHFEKIQFQAIECCLVNVECNGTEWDDTFETLITIGDKILHAEVLCFLCYFRNI